MWNSWLTLSPSSAPDLLFMRVNAVRMNRDCEDKSPGSPMAPMPRLYSSSGRAGAKRFSGGFGDRWA